jgi:hypothetical protein
LNLKRDILVSSRCSFACTLYRRYSTAVPGAALYGCAPAARWEWHRVLVLGGGAFRAADFVWFGGAWWGCVYKLNAVDP